MRNDIIAHVLDVSIKACCVHHVLRTYTSLTPFRSPFLYIGT